MWYTQQARERTPEQTNPEKSNPEVKINNLIFCYILRKEKFKTRVQPSIPLLSYLRWSRWRTNLLQVGIKFFIILAYHIRTESLFLNTGCANLNKSSCFSYFLHLSVFPKFLHLFRVTIGKFSRRFLNINAVTMETVVLKCWYLILILSLVLDTTGLSRSLFFFFF